jgi:Lrp/AsnC family leucine-responsive transcriptional regulator
VPSRKPAAPAAAPLDAIDRQILAHLQKEGRITNAELSRRVGLSTASVLERVRKLERTGVVRGYAALVSPASVGLHCLAYVEVTLDRHVKATVRRFMNEITELEEVLECHHITGEADFLVKVTTRDIPAYEDFILHKLTALRDVRNLKTLIVLSTLKQETALPLTEAGEERR